MYTYVIKSSKYHKIGRASDMDSRLKTYETHNPDFSVIYVVSGDYESSLHNYFSDKRVKGEWFLLSDIDVEYLMQNIQEIYDLYYNKIKDSRKPKTDWKKHYVDIRKRARCADFEIIQSIEVKEKDITTNVLI